MGPEDDRLSLLAAGALTAYGMHFSGEAIEVVRKSGKLVAKNPSLQERFDGLHQYWGSLNLGTMEMGGREYVVVLLPMANQSPQIQKLLDKLTPGYPGRPNPSGIPLVKPQKIQKGF